MKPQVMVKALDLSKVVQPNTQKKAMNSVAKQQPKSTKKPAAKKSVSKTESKVVKAKAAPSTNKKLAVNSPKIIKQT